MKLRRSLVCSSVVAAAAILSLAGCGSGSSSDTADTTTAAAQEDTTVADEETDAETDAPEETDAETEAPEETDAETDAPEETDEETEAPTMDQEAFDAATYHGYLCFQTPSYSFRDQCDSASYGVNGTDNTDEISYNVVHAWGEGNVLISAAGEFQDVGISGDGTYTVSVTGLDWASGEFGTSGIYNMIYLSTDIPVDALNGDDFSITIDEFTIGGKVIDLDQDMIFDNWEDTKEEDELTTGIQVKIQNCYGDNKDIGSYDEFASTMTITFTVSGLDAYEGEPTVEY